MLSLFACTLNAQAPKHITEKNDMRIFSKNSEEVLTNFPSSVLGRDVRISIVFPEGYEDGDNYKAVYLFANRNFNHNTIADLFYAKNSPAKDTVFISFVAHGEIPQNKITDFLARDIVPYFETNYKMADGPESRIIAAQGDIALNILESFGTLNNYFKNAALFLHNTTPLFDIKGQLPKDIRIWMAGNLSNMARMQAVLEKAGLKPFKNFAFNFAELKKDELFYKDINFDYLYAKNPSKIKKARAVFSKKELSSTADDFSSFWLSVNAQDYEAVYIPQTLKIAPPFLSWDAQTARLTPIFGATSGRVKISADIPFYGNFKTTLKID